MATASVLIPGVKRQPRIVTSVAGRSHFRDVLFEKAIDNSRLYREADPEKRRQCFTMMGIVALAFIFVFFFAWEHFRCVRYGYEIEQLKSQRATLSVWNERLYLEQALLADPQRIDQLARADLGLAPPAPRQVVRLGDAGGSPAQPSAPVFARNFGSLRPTTRGNAREP